MSNSPLKSSHWSYWSVFIWNKLTHTLWDPKRWALPGGSKTRDIFLMGTVSVEARDPCGQQHWEPGSSCPSFILQPWSFCLSWFGTLELWRREKLPGAFVLMLAKRAPVGVGRTHPSQMEYWFFGSLAEIWSMYDCGIVQMWPCKSFFLMYWCVSGVS